MLAVYLTLIDEEDTDVFEMIYIKYKKLFFVRSMEILNNIQLAEDAVSETFFSLAKNFKKVHNLNPSEILALAIIINKNITFKIYNGEKKHLDYDDHEDLTEDSGDFSLEDTVEDRAILSAVKKLPGVYRDIIMMKYYYDLTVDDIVKMIGIPLCTVKYRLSKARQLLRKELKGCERP